MTLFVRRFLYALGTLLLLNVVAWVAYADLVPDGKLHVDFLDVGQGDAILVQTPSRHVALVDGGPDNSVLARLGEELPFFRRRIDLMVLTHPHADHVAGLIEVLRKYSVKRVLFTGALHTTDTYLAFLREIKEQRIPVTVAVAGVRVQFDTSTRLDVLHPFASLDAMRVEDLNNTSIVAHLRFGKTAVLLTGDAEIPVTTKLLEQPAFLRTDVLKVAHQGSRDATTAQFIEIASPRYAVVSVGKNNRFGHPHPEVLDMLTKEGIDVFRTDEQGTIHMTSDGATIRVVSGP